MFKVFVKQKALRATPSAPYFVYGDDIVAESMSRMSSIEPREK